MDILYYINTLNSSKYFTGIMMLMLNIGSRFVEIKFNDSMESFVKSNIAKELLIFTMAWMGTRDIIVAFILTASFVILSEFLLNNNSNYCIISKKYSMKIDKNKDGIISDNEINEAIAVLEKAKKQKENVRNMDLLNYYQSLT
tara:strand:+ start:222 stop:650 length:429 start_codon:yes stop_codon:yes gene_type:complete